MVQGGVLRRGRGINAGYWLYPTKSDTAPVNILSTTGTNNANFYDHFGTGNGGFTDPLNYLTPVGAFASSPGPYGTFDMGGDVLQWIETPVGTSFRGQWSASWYENSTNMASSAYGTNGSPITQYGDVGFRVVMVPEPGSVEMLVAGAWAIMFSASPAPQTRLTGDRNFSKTTHLKGFGHGNSQLVERSFSFRRPERAVKRRPKCRRAASAGSNPFTGGGRAFFAGVIARDGFNGLRLWERTLNPRLPGAASTSTLSRAACSPSPRQNWPGHLAYSSSAASSPRFRSMMNPIGRLPPLSIRSFAVWKYSAM